MTVKRTAQEIYKQILKWMTQQVKEKTFFKETAIALVLAVTAVGGFYIYRFYRTSNEQEAQKAFTECIHEYQRALSGSDEAWSEVAMVCKLGYDRHSSTTLGPFFLGLQIDALVWQNKRAEALELMDQMINQLPLDGPFTTLYQTKQALLQIDSDDSALQDKGRIALEKLAHDTNNMQADKAYYYLGYYYWMRDNLDKAKVVWQELIDKFDREDPKANSIWAALAEQKMQHIS